MVSVLTITYNRAHLIGDTIRSVLDQTYSDFEYIIVDDGSTDHTEDVIAEFNDPRIKYFKLSRIGHLGKLRNYGIGKASRKYIALIDSDDTWEKEKLTVQVDILEHHPEAGFSFCDVQIYHFDKLTKSHIYDHEEDIISTDFFHDFITGKLAIYFSSTMLFKKACHDAIGPINEDMKSGDHDFWCKLLLTFKGVLVRKSLTHIKRHDHNHSDLVGAEPFREYIQTLDALLKDQHISRTIHRKMVGQNHYQMGLYYSRSNQKAQARKAYWDSLKTDPFRYKALIRFLLPGLD